MTTQNPYTEWLNEFEQIEKDLMAGSEEMVPFSLFEIPRAIVELKKRDKAIEIAISTIRTLGLGDPSQIGGNPLQRFVEARLNQIKEILEK